MRNPTRSFDRPSTENPVDMSTAVMDTGYVYVGGTVPEGPITLIKMVTAFTTLGHYD